MKQNQFRCNQLIVVLLPTRCSDLVFQVEHQTRCNAVAEGPGGEARARVSKLEVAKMRLLVVLRVYNEW